MTLQTKIGVVASLLDPKFFTGVSATTIAASLFAGELWGVAAGGALAFGKVSLEATKLSVEAAGKVREKDFEIAYIHEIRKNFG